MIGPHLKINSFVGEVVQGLDVVTAIEKLGSASGTTKVKVTIAASGTV